MVVFNPSCWTRSRGVEGFYSEGRNHLHGSYLRRNGDDNPSTESGDGVTGGRVHPMTSSTMSDFLTLPTVPGSQGLPTLDETDSHPYCSLSSFTPCRSTLLETSQIPTSHLVPEVTWNPQDQTQMEKLPPPPQHDSTIVPPITLVDSGERSRRRERESPLSPCVSPTGLVATPISRWT